MMFFKDVLFNLVFPFVGGSMVAIGINNHEGIIIVDGILIFALSFILDRQDE